MKKKYLSILLTLVLALSLCLVTAVPVAAEEAATLLSSTGAIGTSNADTIIVEVPAGTTLGQIDSIAWSEYLIQGYPPHVDIMLDLDDDGTADDALVIEYAYNTELHYAEAPMPYGALTGAWYQTFSDDGNGPATITDTANAWLTSRASGPPGADPDLFAYHTLADWKEGITVAELGEWPAKTINGDSLVLCLEIEVDNWQVDCVALVNNIVLGYSGDVGPVEMTASSLGEIIAISVSPTSVNFGSLVPGTPSVAQTVTATNIGNVVADFSATIENASVPDVYTTGLQIDAGSVSAWLPTGVAVDASEEASLVLTVPSGTSAGTYTATLVFWAEMTTQ